MASLYLFHCILAGSRLWRVLYIYSMLHNSIHRIPYKYCEFEFWRGKAFFTVGDKGDFSLPTLSRGLTFLSCFYSLSWDILIYRPASCFDHGLDTCSNNGCDQSSGQCPATGLARPVSDSRATGLRPATPITTGDRHYYYSKRVLILVFRLIHSIKITYCKTKN